MITLKIETHQHNSIQFTYDKLIKQLVEQMSREDLFEFIHGLCSEHPSDSRVRRLISKMAWHEISGEEDRVELSLDEYLANVFGEPMSSVEGIEERLRKVETEGQERLEEVDAMNERLNNYQDKEAISNIVDEKVKKKLNSLIDDMRERLDDIDERLHKIGISKECKEES